MGSGTVGSSGFDGVLNGSDAWGTGRRRTSGQLSGARLDDVDSDQNATSVAQIEEEGSNKRSITRTNDMPPSEGPKSQPESAEVNSVQQGLGALTFGQATSKPQTINHPGAGSATAVSSTPLEVHGLTAIKWVYMDPEGNIQGRAYVYCDFPVIYSACLLCKIFTRTISFRYHAELV